MEQAIQESPVTEHPVSQYEEEFKEPVDRILQLNSKVVAVMESALVVADGLVKENERPKRENERLKKELEECQDRIAALDGFPMQPSRSSNRVDG